MEKREKRQKQKETFKKVLRYIKKYWFLSDPFYIVSSNYGSAHTLHSDFDR